MTARLYFAVFGARPKKPATKTGTPARKLDVTEREWRQLRRDVFARDGFTCVYCFTYFGGRTEDLHADHVFPFSRGGRSVMGNLATACGPCNASKGAKTLEEWRQ